MKNIFKVAIGALALTAATSSFAGQYPFPQNMKHPNGTTIEYANTDMIKSHYQKWKKAWYNSNNGWIYAPEGTGSTVSEAICSRSCDGFQAVEQGFLLERRQEDYLLDWLQRY